MKPQLQWITAVSAVSLLSAPLQAQEPVSATPGGQVFEQTPSHLPPRTERLGRAAKASELLGMEVRNYQGDKLGKVDDFAVDLDTGRILQVILSSGGFLGIGDSRIAVPPGALHHDLADKVIHVNADKEKFTAAPKFDNSKWAASCESNQMANVYRYFGEEPYFTTGTQPLPAPHPSARICLARKATDVIGMSVENLRDEKIGKVENLIVDLSAGRVVAVIVSSGGFLGMNDELSAIPPTVFRASSDREGLQLDTTRDALGRAPHFKKDQWPQIGDPTYTEVVYRAHGTVPYFTTNAVPPAGNTNEQVRFPGNRILTPLDQGNSSGDRDRSAQIRRQILASPGLSAGARNIVIITMDGRVTLRGPVTTAEEKRLLGGIAVAIAGAGDVDNQIVVQ